MAKKDYHLTQTGQEVQDILNEAQRVYQCLPEQVEHPDEGDICFVPAHDENIDLEYVSGSQTEPFLIPEGVHLIKTKIVAPAVANWIVVIRRPQEMGINLITTGEVPEEYVANVGVEPGTTPYIYWYDKDESYLQYLTVYYEVAAVCYEYMNGSWVERTDLAQTLEKAKSAYQKPATGIPASDIADGVIPQTLVSGQYVVPNPYSDVKTIEETAEEFGITEQQVRDLFDGKYAYIKFDKTVLSITVVSKDPSWCVKFVSKDDLVEYTLYGVTIIAGTFILIGTTFYKYVAESTSRKVTTLSGESTDAEYPSAKAVYNAIKDAATAGLSYDSITESVVVEPPHGSYNESTETITL